LQGKVQNLTLALKNINSRARRETDSEDETWNLLILAVTFARVFVAYGRQSNCKNYIFGDFLRFFWYVCGEIRTILTIWLRYLSQSGQFQRAENFLRPDNSRLGGHRHFGGLSGVLVFPPSPWNARCPSLLAVTATL
jgi:hypothetical protein